MLERAKQYGNLQVPVLKQELPTVEALQALGESGSGEELTWTPTKTKAVVPEKAAKRTAASERKTSATPGRLSRERMERL